MSPLSLPAMARRRLLFAAHVVTAHVVAAHVVAFTGIDVVLLPVARAEELPYMALRDIPEIPPLTWHGLTLYGTVDLSAQYESRGTPLNPKLYGSLDIIAPQSRGARVVIAPNQVAQSVLGLRAEEPIGHAIDFVGKLEIGFNPNNGRLSDAPGSIRDQNGLPTGSQSASADGPRAGQLLNGDAYAGFSTPWGTLVGGRTTTFSFDSLVAYDPLLSYGFSLVGYQGIAAGQGSSESLRIDSSLKYTFSHGPFHGGVMYAEPGTSAKRLWQAQAGLQGHGVTFDAIGGRAYDQISPSALSDPANLGSSFLGAKVFDTAMVGLFGQYKYLLAPASDLTFSAGWERIDFSNPSDGGWAPGHLTIGGYPLGPGFSTNGSATSGILNYGFTGGDRILRVTFLGAKYQMNPEWAFRAGYYRYDQNSFGFGVSSIAPAASAIYSPTHCDSKKQANCAGQEAVYSLRADYQMTRNIMLYGGSVFSTVSNGLAFGYLHTSAFSQTFGVKTSF